MASMSWSTVVGYATHWSTVVGDATHWSTVVGDPFVNNS